MNQTFLLRTLTQGLGKNMQLHLNREQQQLQRLRELLPKGGRTTLQRRVRECDDIDGKLRLLSPENVLKRGYSITLKDGKAVTDAADLQPGDQLVTRFHKGEVSSRVE